MADKRSLHENGRLALKEAVGGGIDGPALSVGLGLHGWRDEEAEGGVEVDHRDGDCGCRRMKRVAERVER